MSHPIFHLLHHPCVICSIIHVIINPHSSRRRVMAITQILNPMLPAVFVVGQTVAAERMARRDIYCTGFDRITMAGARRQLGLFGHCRVFFAASIMRIYWALLLSLNWLRY
jgi:hypothetical protein